MKGYLCARLWLLIFATIIIPHNITEASDLTDDQKKEIVYKMYEDYKKDFSAVKDISPREAMKLMATGQALFVDIRKPSEIEVSMLSDTVTEESFLKMPSKYRNRTIIVYCTIGSRSGKLAMEMAKKEVDMYNLRGGLLAWVLEGGKVYDANGETKRVHVYGEKWNYLPGGYEPIMFGFFEKLF